MKKKQPTYSPEFKKKIVELRASGRSGVELAREYGITKTTIYDWEKKFKNSGSFKTADNMSEDEIELRKLRKENKQLRMEVDILKQAALIMGRRGE